LNTGGTEEEEEAARGGCGVGGQNDVRSDVMKASIMDVFSSVDQRFILAVVGSR
jgi:hypothetical protein